MQPKEPSIPFDPKTKNVPSDVFGAEELFTALRMTGSKRAATANMFIN